MVKEYETILVKMVMAVVAAAAVVMGVILLMGIQFSTCNPFILVMGVITVAALFTVGTVI